MCFCFFWILTSYIMGEIFWLIFYGKVVKRGIALLASEIWVFAFFRLFIVCSILFAFGESSLLWSAYGWCSQGTDSAVATWAVICCSLLCWQLALPFLNLCYFGFWWWNCVLCAFSWIGSCEQQIIACNY